MTTKHITTIIAGTVRKEGGCGECQTSCQSACKTSCTVGNQVCMATTRETKIKAGQETIA